MADAEPGGLLIPLRILDLAQGAAGLCSRLLADLGASVIKVEPPGGDPSRHEGPFHPAAPPPEASLSFLHHNRGKRGITLDLETPEGQGRLLELATGADVVVESFRPGRLASLGLGFDRLGEANPRLILASVTGFGQDGPHSRHLSCDLVAAACGGPMSVCGAPSGPPLKPYGDQPAYAASLFAAVGILLALRRRAASGQGEWIDVSCQESAAATLDHVLVRYFQDRQVARRRGGVSWNGSSFLLPCRDGLVQVHIAAQWETLVGWMASEGMAAELAAAAWGDEGYRRRHTGRLIEVMAAWTQTHSRAELCELAQALRLPWAPVASPAEILASAQLEARGFFRTEPDDRGGPRLAWPGLPYRFDPPAPVPGKRAPRLGEDSHGFTRDEPGLSTAGIGRLAARKAVQGPGMADGILAGIRVLDFTWVLAGPYATRLLADFGAEVIKVQSAKTAQGAEANLGGYFAAWNRNKRSVTLDMARSEARALARRLAAMSDVVVENFSPRVKENWGFGYAGLAEANPRLVMASLSGFGQTGPWRDCVAFGPTVQALSGLTWLTSTGQGEPAGLGYAYADPVAGLYGALAILAALENRDRTGQGRYVDLSEYEAACSLAGPALLAAQCSPDAARPPGAGSGDRPAAPYGCYRCTGEDRWCVIAVFAERQWQALVEQMGSPGWAREGRFASAERRQAHRSELDRRIGEWTVLHAAEEIAFRLQQAAVPAGVVQDAADLAKDPHLRARGFFVPLDHPVLGTTVADASPIRFCGGSAPQWKAAPLLGEANRDVFCGLLGLSDAEFARLVEDGVIG